MAVTALFAGSFDPVTNGHVDIIRRARPMFDRLVVAVGDNPAKSYMLEQDLRMSLIREAVKDLEGVDVVSFQGLLVDACRANNASVIVRALRDSADFAGEARYALANRDLSGLDTVFLLADPALMWVSSTIVKEIRSYGGDFTRYVPACVVEAVRSGGED